jgi:hypothetical protein
LELTVTKYLLIFLGVLFLAIPASASNLCGTKYCTARDYQIGSGPIGSAANTNTVIGTCELLCTSANLCVWALRSYASVSTGPVFRASLYALTPTGGTKTVQLDRTSAIGLYGSSLTGVTVSSCGFTK